MAIPSFTMRQLLEAGIHFGHHTRRWNPKMAPYLFGVRNGIHIIDLQQTVPMLHRAMQAVRDVAAGGGRVLFVGTKRQASDPIAEAAKRCGQYYVNHRWLGGMLTNWQTISKSIRRLREAEEQLAEGDIGLTKKELLHLTRERDKLERALGGIKEMGGVPDILFVVDTLKEAIALKEARKLGIPVVAVVDSNSDPDGISYPIPGNDDAMRAINLYCGLMSDAVLDGLQQEMIHAGVDVGAAEKAPVEALPEGTPGEEGAAAAQPPGVAGEAAPAGDAAQPPIPEPAVGPAPAPPAGPAEAASPEPPAPAEGAKSAAAAPAGAGATPQPEPGPDAAVTVPEGETTAKEEQRPRKGVKRQAKDAPKAKAAGKETGAGPETAKKAKSAGKETSAKGAAAKTKKAQGAAPSEKADTPSDKADAPSEEADTPSEKTDTPSDKADAPSEEADTPSEKADTPSDKADAPSEEAAAPSEKAAAPSEKAAAPSKKAAAPSEE